MSELSPEISASRLLIGDADALFRESLAHNLRHAGFSVEEALTGAEILQRCVDIPSPDLVLLEWKLPEMSAITLLSEMRLRPLEIPVLILTALDAQLYEEAALRAGAVDFVEKHRAFTILLHRIELILAGKKRSADEQGDNADNREIRMGQLDLRPDVSRALWKGRRVDLTLAEFRIVYRLVATPDLDVSHKAIYDAMKDDKMSKDQVAADCRANVRSAIKRIRQKFRTIDPHFENIRSLSGFGYRWNRQRPPTT